MSSVIGNRRHGMVGKAATLLPQRQSIAALLPAALIAAYIMVTAPEEPLLSILFMGAFTAAIFQGLLFFGYLIALHVTHFVAGTVGSELEHSLASTTSVAGLLLAAGLWVWGDVSRERQFKILADCFRTAEQERGTGDPEDFMRWCLDVYDDLGPEPDP